MKVQVIEMQRSVARRLPGGETETLTQGTRYSLDAKTAAPYLQPSRRFVRNPQTGSLEETELPPAATLIEETEIADSDEARAAQAKAGADKASAESAAQEKAYFQQASEAELARDLEAEDFERAIAEEFEPESAGDE